MLQDPGDVRGWGLDFASYWKIQSLIYSVSGDAIRFFTHLTNGSNLWKREFCS